MTNAVMPSIPTLAQPAALPLPPLPSFAYFIGKVDVADRPQTVEETTDLICEDFETKVDSAIEAYGLVAKPPRERLQDYIAKYTQPWGDWAQMPPNSRWQECQLKFPRDYERLWADYQSLLQRAARGDWTDA